MFRRMFRSDRNAKPARLLARMAGLSAGLKQTRRGSFLIMVVGTLALLSVITVIYVSIGRSDRQTSAAVLKFDERKDAPEVTRDYIAGVIADDLFDTVYLGERDGNGEPVYRREGWDYPSAAEFTLRPRGRALNNPDQIVPVTVGGASQLRPGEHGFDPTGDGTGTDPWLASSELSLQNFDAASVYETDPTQYPYERLDWLNISNLAPDGAFVNLANLHGTYDPKTQRFTGNFDASPWEMRGWSDPRKPNSLGATVTLFANSPDADAQRNGDPDYGSTLIDPTDPNGLALPAQWGARQRWMGFPAVEPRLRPGDKRYLLYQYADADGDGILDSRWIELVEDRLLADNLTSYILAPDENMRFFVAARVVDLSGRVNVNTATDSTLNPDWTSQMFNEPAEPVGLTPAAVDIRRLLTLEDFYSDPTIGFGYEGHVQPNHPGVPDDEDPANYLDYTDLNAGPNAYSAGEKAYDALRMVLDIGLIPEPNFAGLQLFGGGAEVNREFSVSLGGSTLNPYWTSYWKLNGNPLGANDYFTVFAGFGLNGGSGYVQGGNLESGLLGRPFGLDSLAELLTFNGVNDDRIRSALEATLGGRGDPFLIPPDLARRYSPMRDNRPTDDVERRRGQWNARNYDFYPEAMRALYTDIRQRLTTYSVSRPLMSSQVPSVRKGNEYAPDPDKLGLAEKDAKKSLGALFGPNGAQTLFELYADALAPYSASQNNPNHWDGSAPEYDTLYYGYRGPMLALRTAAHLAVNMLDSYDSDNGPSKRTVLLDGSDDFRDNEILQGGGDRNPIYPWVLLDLDADATNSGVNPRLWATNGNFPASAPRAVNVYGVEAQPFITEAATFIMYTDAPEVAGGDADDEPRIGDGGGFGGGLPKNEPTIDGNVHPDNPDFICEVFAFQLHNPFDESITLSGSGDADNDGDIDFDDVGFARRNLYYVQYGEHYFKLTDPFDQTTGDPLPNGDELTITIGPGSSKTFYILSESREDIARRILDVTENIGYHDAGDLPDMTTERLRVNQWLDRVLPEAIEIAAFDRVTGAVDTAGDRWINFQEPNPVDPANLTDRQMLRLFRVEKPFEENGGIQIDGSNEGFPGVTENEPENDSIVDRLRDPEIGNTVASVATLNRRACDDDSLTPDNRRIIGADKGFEPPDGPSGENTGLTVMRYASIRRRDDPNASGGLGGSVPERGLPAYCVELKDQTDPGDPNRDARNVTYDDGVTDVRRWNASQFNGPFAEDTLDDLLDKMTGTSLRQAVPTVTTEPRLKRGDTRNSVTFEPLLNNRANIPFEGTAGLGVDYYPPRYVEANLDNDQFEFNGVSRMRVADLLLPLGIGPVQISDPTIHLNNEDVEWTTLSEALAMALNYENDTGVSNVYNGAFDQPVLGSGGVDNSLLDRGQVRFDWFVPFVESVTVNREFDVGERRWGLGVPAAAQILDGVSVLDPRFASFTAPTSGLININTASRETLRSLPMLSPPNVTNPDNSTNWWWNGTDHDWNSDIATTMAAYRDRQSLFVRNPMGTAQPGDRINFRAWWDPSFAGRIDPPPLGSAPGDDPADNARWGSTGVRGINEKPGFRSLGEITFLRDWGYTSDLHDIDRFGFDDSNLDIEGLDSISYDTNGDNVNDDDDEIVDDFGERLAIANAVMSSSSVRSDVFAVWFIVHGYRESDVKGLSDQDPLVPSMARRYMMVVDRSNVVEPGDKPKVLLFKEVPL